MRKKFVKGELVKHKLTKEVMLILEPDFDTEGCCSVHQKKVFKGYYRLRKQDYGIEHLHQDELLYADNSGLL